MKMYILATPYVNTLHCLLRKSLKSVFNAQNAKRDLPLLHDQHYNAKETQGSENQEDGNRESGD